MTPWGTVLSGEENFNQYFDTVRRARLRATPTSYARYGITGTGARGWSEVDPRFDLTTEPHEPFRFGWIVEVDPYDPTSTPRKHTMLGRFKHEGANVAIADSGHAVAYMGDDERGDYIYKFVSADTLRPGGDRRARRKRNLTAAHQGHALRRPVHRRRRRRTAQYDGTGEWIPLTTDTDVVRRRA